MSHTKETRQELMTRLRDLQNQIDHQDILTISAVLSDDQLRAHIERYEGRPVRFAETSTLGMLTAMTRRRR